MPRADTAPSAILLSTMLGPRSRRTFFRALRPAVTSAAPLRSGCGSFPFLESAGGSTCREICNLCSYLVHSPSPLSLSLSVAIWNSNLIPDPVRDDEASSIGVSSRRFYRAFYKSNLNLCSTCTYDAASNNHHCRRSLSLVGITPAPCLVTVKLINTSSRSTRESAADSAALRTKRNRAADFARSIDAFHQASCINLEDRV